MKRALLIVIASCVAASAAAGQRGTIADTLAPRVRAPISYGIDSVLFRFHSERYPKFTLPESFTAKSPGQFHYMVRWSVGRRGFIEARCYELRRQIASLTEVSGTAAATDSTQVALARRQHAVQVSCDTVPDPFRR